MPHMVMGSGATRTSYSTSCSSRRMGHLFVEAREHMNSEFGIFECMRRMPASLCLNLQCLSSECLKPGVGIWPNVLNLGFTNTTAVRMMFHTNTTRVREVSPRGCPNGFFFCKVGTSKMFTMFKSMTKHKHKLLWGNCARSCKTIYCVLIHV